MSRRQDLSTFTSVVDFWETCHDRTAGEDLTWYITGSTPTEELGNLNVGSFLSQPRSILVIGVGKGFTTQELARLGHRVDALDISHEALGKVKAITHRRFTPAQLGELPDSTYDLTLSHLVAQHMRDEDLALQLRHVFRSLRPDGTFAIQFTCALSADRFESKAPTDNECMLGMVTRSLGKFERLVFDAGGEIRLVFQHSVYPGNNLCWYIAHLGKRSP